MRFLFLICFTLFCFPLVLLFSAWVACIILFLTGFLILLIFTRFSSRFISDVKLSPRAWCLHSIAYQFALPNCLWIEYLCVTGAKLLTCLITSCFFLMKAGIWILPKCWPRIKIHFRLPEELILFVFTCLVSGISGTISKILVPHSKNLCKTCDHS